MMENQSSEIKGESKDGEENNELNKKSSNTASSELTCPGNPKMPLKKAKYPWQVKNRRKRRKVITNFFDRDSKHKFSSQLPKCYHQSSKNPNVDAVTQEILADAHLKPPLKETPQEFNSLDENCNTTKRDFREFEPQKEWCKSRESPVGILLRSMDEVAILAQKQDNLLTTMQPELLKHYMKGIAENSINKILEATGAAPSGNPGKKYRLNQEELEDEAVSVVIRQHGIHAANYSPNKNIKTCQCKGGENLCNESDSKVNSSISSNEDFSTKPIESEINHCFDGEIKIDSFSSERQNVTSDDLLDAAVFSAITDKGLGI